MIDTASDGSDLVLVVDKGSAAGIGRGWRGVLVTDGGRPIANTTLEFVSADRNTARMRLTKATTLPSQRVRLSPP